MARPLGSKNKTPAELKIDAKILARKAELKELTAKKKALRQQRQVKP
jgi:hypothetical protein